MDFLEFRNQQLLYNFEEFEREFLLPYDPESVTNLKSGKNMSWIEEMEQEFISSQLNVRKFQLSGSKSPMSKQLEINLRLSNQIHEISDLPPPLIEDLDFESPNQANNSNDPLISGSLSSNLIKSHHNKNVKPSNEQNLNKEENIVYIELSDTTNESSDFSLEYLNMNIESPTQFQNIAYPPTPSSSLLKELGYELTKEMNDTNDPLIIGSSRSNLLVPPHAEHINTYGLISSDEYDLPPLDPSFLEFIDFEIPASLQMEIDKTTYINKATTDYGEEFAKKVDGNLKILQETMKRTSQCSNRREKGGKGVCCGGKCWRYMESKLSSMQNIPRGRKRKGFELTADQINLNKQRQKIRNRESAAAAYKKLKAHIEKLETQVKDLKGENKIRRNLIKFMEGASQIPLEKRSLGRTTSGSV